MKVYGSQVFYKKEVSGLQLGEIATEMGYLPENFYILCNGKKVENDAYIQNSTIHIVPRLVGGKGGFGSMLRAIGAQIEKTTNREACRDLSGRRLRDINEEKRLKNWINQQAEREKEAKERKQKKLERLCEQPKHEFKDEDYDRERSELPEKVEDAVLKGLQASCSTKRKSDEKEFVVKKKKPRLWVDDELDEDVSSSDDISDNEVAPRSESLEKEKCGIEAVSDSQGKSNHVENKTSKDELGDNKQVKEDETKF